MEEFSDLQYHIVDLNMIYIVQDTQHIHVGHLQTIHALKEVIKQRHPELKGLITSSLKFSVYMKKEWLDITKLEPNIKSIGDLIKVVQKGRNLRIVVPIRVLTISYRLFTPDKIPHTSHLGNQVLDVILNEECDVNDFTIAVKKFCGDYIDDEILVTNDIVSMKPLKHEMKLKDINIKRPLFVIVAETYKWSLGGNLISLLY